VLEAVRRCWASLWTPRAIGYRAGRAIAADEVSMAVVVQRLATADAAGVLFTVDPAGGGGDRVVVNANWGLGDAVAGGKVTREAKRQTPVLSPSEASELARTGLAIEELFGQAEDDSRGGLGSAGQTTAETAAIARGMVARPGHRTSRAPGLAEGVAWLVSNPKMPVCSATVRSS
jgi:hypothetical protein